MALTAHKTVTMFMRYVHTEEDPARAAPETVAESTAEGDKPLGFEDGNYRSRTKLGNYRPFRHRDGPNRAVPIGTKRNANEVKDLPLRRQRS
jgi:hypothetical protein